MIGNDNTSILEREHARTLGTWFSSGNMIQDGCFDYYPKTAQIDVDNDNDTDTDEDDDDDDRGCGAAGGSAPMAVNSDYVVILAKASKIKWSDNGVTRLLT